ncbi:metalloregulator ArsR/SmtB family transcription factor [Thermanaerothrix sp. 4228-RoL]|uniref:Metalloregulator ArsR/SmtB family transcription factor n=1 Tax=Thermanaerothrix solaris TaxID=3058434 RepID=A0ABU3NRI0_9CHLR|nr:metalloregulator ArsR/SmtB family transcription factor [Thermanaerothrix sp. 4228-RoL]MDT8898667.1 metalloregulator ArsR/SmtB family transcription factor [Thermanaerothrix sp. 4228-RoL]
MGKNGASPHCEDNQIHESLVRQVQAHLLDGLTATRLAEVFAALSDPSRIRLLAALAEAELCVHDLAAVLGMSQSAVSHQLRLLRALHLVRFRKEGRTVFYTLDDEHIRDLLERGLEHIRHQNQSQVESEERTHA